MNRISYILIAVLFIFFSGCINPDNASDKVNSSAGDTPFTQETEATMTPVNTAIPTPAFEKMNVTETPDKIKSGGLLIDNISQNLTSFYDKGWVNLYQGDELDCSRMSTYFWKYIRDKYHVAPKIIVSYQRQHAWLALKVGEVGNSSNYRHWNIKGIDYYYLEATIPKIVVDDNRRFVINDQTYTSAEFYNATIYVFDTPQDAGDFHADYSILRGFNQEFVLKYDDMVKIETFLKN